MPHGVSRCCWRLGLLAAASAQRAVGPVAAGRGWAVDHGYPLFDDDVLTMRGDSRLYLVEDHTRSSWDDHKYARAKTLISLQLPREVRSYGEPQCARAPDLG